MLQVIYASVEGNMKCYRWVMLVQKSYASIEGNMKCYR